VRRFLVEISPEGEDVHVAVFRVGTGDPDDPALVADICPAVSMVNLGNRQFQDIILNAVSAHIQRYGMRR
jgi:hypothetical protein